MARRNDHSRDELYNLTLEAAYWAVSKEGARSLTTRKLAKEIGYSVGTLYNLFEDQDDLIVHLNGRTLDALSEVLLAVSEDADPEKLIHNIAKAYIDFTVQNFNLWNCLFEHRLPEGRELPDWYHKKIFDLLAYVEKSLLPLCQNDVNESKKTARVLWASLHGICTLAVTGKLEVVATKSAEELTTSLIDNYLTGLKVNHTA